MSAYKGQLLFSCHTSIIKRLPVVSGNSSINTKCRAIQHFLIKNILFLVQYTLHVVGV